MGIADLLAHKSGPPMPEDDAGGGKSGMAAASIKAFWDACKAGDFEQAAEHMGAAMEHCEPGGDDEAGGSDHALLLVPHGGK